MRGIRSRRWAVAAMVAACAWLTAIPAWAEGVRPLQPRGTRLLEDGVRRSEVLRLLVNAIAESDLVVYVDLEDRDPNGTTRVEAHLRFAGATAATRYLEVWLQPRQTDDRLVALLAHELQHAVEVACVPAVRSAAAFRTFYEKAGRSANRDRFCTSAAEQVTGLVGRELAAWRQ
jgi:hypothetical protein